MESVREVYGSVREVYRSVQEGYGCYSHQTKSVHGQFGSVRVGYGKYGRLHVEVTLHNLSRPTA